MDYSNYTLKCLFIQDIYQKTKLWYNHIIKTDKRGLYEI
jgi:hypothetical protein